MPHRAPLLVALPKGLTASGVTTWALRLLAALKARGHPAGLIVHGGPPGQRELEADVSFLDVFVDLRKSTGPLLDAAPAYADAARLLWAAAKRPVVMSPNLLGDCYGLCAALTQTDPKSRRVIGVMHADIPYDLRVLEHYAPVISRFVGVSRRTAAALRERLGERAADVVYVPHGVEAPARPPEREPLAGRALRMVYTGRVEQPQKRVGVLALLSDELRARGVEHTIDVVGDGPAMEEMRALAATRPSLRLRGAVAPDEVRRHLDRADLFVLPSRYEGLSVAMLEAMARGCAPVVSNVASGAGEAVRDGENGALVNVPEDADDAGAAKAFADAAARVLAIGAARLGEAAWRTVRERFSFEAHVSAWSALVDGAAAGPARAWPLDRPCAFTGSGGGSGTVPREGAAKLAALLERLSGRAVVIHGAGRHTIELAHVLAASPARIVGVTDDDPERWGSSLLGWTVTDPARAAELGATDVVLSSWLHQDALWAKRGRYESAGLRAHRIYE